MVRKATPAEKAARLLDLVPYLYSHQGISIAELASVFSATESDILSDLNTLWMCGESRFDLVDLEFESGYVSIHNAETLNMVRSLSVQETMSILFGLDLLREEIDQTREDLVAEIDQMRSLISEEISQVVSATPSIKPTIQSAIDTAIKSRKALKVSYHSISDDQISERIIDPLELIFRDNKLFLNAFCREVQSNRTFRVDRFQSAEVTDSEIDVDHSWVGAEEAITVTLKIHSDSRKVRELFTHLNANPDGTYSTAVFSKQWLIREVLAAEGEIEILTPLSIRKEILGVTKHLESAYR